MKFKFLKQRNARSELARRIVELNTRTNNSIDKLIKGDNPAPDYKEHPQQRTVYEAGKALQAKLSQIFPGGGANYTIIEETP